MNTTRVVGYIRVSTEKQGEAGNGLEAQRATIEAYCLANNLELAEVVSEVDSATKGNRPVRFETLRRCQQGEFSGIIVASQSRISRSVIETSQLLDWAEVHGVRVILCDSSVDTGTTAGRLVATILAAVAQAEAEQLSERTRAALAAKKARGEAVSGPTVSELAKAIISEARGQGESFQKIADRLNAEGVPTARGGQQWYAATVRSATGAPRKRKHVIAGLPS
jgi:DNA invertase Pin-like site-specific DNA recombinase